MLHVFDNKNVLFRIMSNIQSGGLYEESCGRNAGFIEKTKAGTVNPFLPCFLNIFDNLYCDYILD